MARVDRLPRAAVARQRLIGTLERYAAALSDGPPVPVDGDRLDLLVELYGCRTDAITDVVLPRFVAEHRRLLADLFRAYRNDVRASTLLAPDALLIFERLGRDPDRLRDLWQRRRPLDELEDLASVYGLPI